MEIAEPAAALMLMNHRTNQAVARHVEVATTRAARRRGLLGRDTLAPSAALILAPCAAIHTLFMRFPIDVVFVDGEGRALKVVPALRPWRMAVEPFAHALVEMPARTLEHARVHVGDRLYLRTADERLVPLSLADLRRESC